VMNSSRIMLSNWEVDNSVVHSHIYLPSTDDKPVTCTQHLPQSVHMATVSTDSACLNIACTSFPHGVHFYQIGNILYWVLCAEDTACWHTWRYLSDRVEINFCGLCNWLTPWSTVLEKLVNKFPALYVIQRFIKVFTAARHWSFPESDESSPHFPSYVPDPPFYV
jgi:hypothetical protein